MNNVYSYRDFGNEHLNLGTFIRLFTLPYKEQSKEDE